MIKIGGKLLLILFSPVIFSFFVIMAAVTGGGIASSGACLDCAARDKQTACSGVSGVQPQNEEESVAIMYSYFTNQGWSKEAIAGMLGNAQAEGGFDPTSVETVFDERFQLGPKKMSIMNGRDKSNRSFPGIGLLGFTYFREEILEEAEKQGLDWYSMEYQLPYIEKIFSTTAWNPYFSSFEELKQSKDIEKVSTAILTCYEKPKIPLPAQRAGFAKNWYDKLDSLGNTSVSSASCNDSSGSIDGGPKFDKTIWLDQNTYDPAFRGQCTWFAYARFMEIYGYSPGFNGDGIKCAGQLVEAHPDKFELSNTPKTGAIFSYQKSNHVGVVVGVNGDKITIEEGNVGYYAWQSGQSPDGVNYIAWNYDWEQTGSTGAGWRRITKTKAEMDEQATVYANPKTDVATGR